MKFKLRHKFATWLIVLGVVPGFGASFLGLSLISIRMERSLSEELNRTVSVGINVLVDELDTLYLNAIRLASLQPVRQLGTQVKRYGSIDPDTALEIKKRGPGADWVNYAIYVRLKDGSWDRVIEDGTLVMDPATVLTQASNYRNFLDYRVSENTGVLYLVAGAPVIDDNYDVVGAVVLEYPLDSGFCKELHTLLGADITIITIPKGIGLYKDAAFTSFPSDVAIPWDKLERYWKGRLSSDVISFEANGRYYSSKLVHIKDRSQRDVALLMVSGDFTKLHEGRQGAVGALLLLSLIAALVVVFLGMRVSEAWVRPLRSVANDAWERAKEHDPSVEREEGEDEVDELKKAISMMVEVLNKRRRLLASKISEISTLHELGLAIRRQYSVKGVAEQAFEELTAVFAAEKGVFLLRDFEPRDPTLQEDELLAAHREGERPEGPELLASFERVVSKGDMNDCGERGTDGTMDDLLQEILTNGPTVLRDVECRGVVGGAMCGAIRYNGTPVALVCLWRREGYSEEHLRVLMASLDIIEAGLVNAKLYEKVKNFMLHLEAMVKERTHELELANAELQRKNEELQSAQTQLALSERMAGLGILLASIAHEINNPVQTIDGMVSLMKEDMKKLLHTFIILGEMGVDTRMIIYALGLLREHMEEEQSFLKERNPSDEAVQELRTRLEAMGLRRARKLAKSLVERGVEDIAYKLMEYGESIGVASAETLLPLLELVELGGKVLRRLATISMAVGTVTRIVRAVRAYSHVTQDRPVETDIHEGLEVSLIILGGQLKKGVEVRKEYGDVPPINAYADDLNQVWTNLIMNAIQAMDGRGTLTIRTFTTTREKDGRERGYVAVEIEDTGKGIPPEMMDKIFEPFVTTKKKGEGSGLGLSITAKIVREKHGGEIEVESRPGRTVFRVLIPMDLEA